MNIKYLNYDSISIELSLDEDPFNSSCIENIHFFNAIFHGDSISLENPDIDSLLDEIIFWLNKIDIFDRIENQLNEMYRRGDFLD